MTITPFFLIGLVALLTSCTSQDVDDQSQIQVLSKQPSKLSNQDHSPSSPPTINTELLPETQKVLHSMSDADLSSRINSQVWGKRSLCLKWTHPDGGACLEWSKDKVGKDNFVKELERRQKETKVASEYNKKSGKTIDFPCNQLSTYSFNFPDRRDMVNMSGAIKSCKSKAPDARAVYDPGWSCFIWSINGPDANKMKQCLVEDFGWKELGPPGWIENTVAAPPF